jgi:predicted DNA-binding transcriptional regulator
MSKDRIIGAGMLVGSIIAIIVYIWILFLTEYFIVLLKITALVAVFVVAGLIGWIGYTLLTTPPPKPIEEIEKEIEEELKKLESESKEVEERREKSSS